VKQLKRIFREVGVEGLIHGNSGRHPANYTREDLRRQIITLKQSGGYERANFTHYRELLEEREHIAIGYTTLCSILKGAGIVSKKAHRVVGKKFVRRRRRVSSGELLQTDATPYDWFCTSERSALHGFIDDATGKITGLYICKNECLMGYLEALRATLTTYGIPQGIYADQAGIFFVNTKKAENWTLEEALSGKVLDKTQFGKIAVDVLGIELIGASTSQAKGRVERLWETLQDRLEVWFKLHNITTIEQANAALPEFIIEFNARFGVQTESTESAFVPLDSKDDLDTLLAVKYERTTDNCGCFSFQNFLFQIKSDRAIAKKRIKFLFSEKIGFKAYYDKRYYPVDFLGVSNSKKGSHIPDVTKQLIEKFYLSDGKEHILTVA
jgi:hypothetical protein